MDYWRLEFIRKVTVTYRQQHGEGSGSSSGPSSRHKLLGRNRGIRTYIAEVGFLFILSKDGSFRRHLQLAVLYFPDMRQGNGSSAHLPG